MNSETHHNAAAAGEQRKSRASDHTLTDDHDDVNPSQAQLQHASPMIRNLQQQPSSASNYTMKAAEVTTDADYLDSLPVGYRFVPTDEELIKDYLMKKIKNESLPKTKIREVYIYEKHPKELVGNYPQAIDDGWYFFTPRSRKYPNGDRPARHAGRGFWKATGPDKVIKENRIKIGGRKSLVYYEGHAPKWIKTKWMMHEYVIKGKVRKGLNSKEKKFDDYVLCKIYINGRMKRHVTSNDQVENEQALVLYQPAHLLPSNEDFENNVVVKHDSDQHTNPTIVEVKNEVTVPNRQANVISNQEVNPLSYQVQNNLSILDSNQHVNRSAEKGVKEVMIKRQVMDGDQHGHVVSYNQVKNNVVVQNYQNMGSLYNPFQHYSRPLRTCHLDGPVQVTSFQAMRNPSLDYTSPATSNHQYSLQQSYFAPAPQQARILTPRNEHAPHGQVRLGMCWSGSSSNPPQPQVAPPSQEGSDCDTDNDITRNIELMYALDGYDGFLDDNYQF
ncbi:hypothetical protein L1987_10105 [Smallanthus sonchifolius]|uniref:Uncharacterized protein n=1 Tax=Smallanthus sonchifolius TaxID=185202 RepID=A0ACB9JR74_9ASTR|nr:hypothetical protein L1987_10105 [Smallanthus sonchifolius]